MFDQELIAQVVAAGGLGIGEIAVPTRYFEEAKMTTHKVYYGTYDWYLAVWTGPWAAAAVSSVLFGAGHLYLDRKAAVRAGIVGAVMAGIVLGCGSLWPAMIIHAAIDINSGSLTFHALKQAQGGSPEPGVAVAA